MKSALVIVNGIRFPYFLANAAIQWARQNGAGLHALFLASGSEMPEGYAFPSDMKLAETLSDREDAAKSTLTVLNEQIELFKDMAGTENIPFEGELMDNPSLEDVLEKAKQASLLFIAPAYGDIALQGVTRFKLQELAEQSPCPVKIVEDDKPDR